MASYRPKGEALVALFELDLFFERKSKCLASHVEHIVDFFYAVVFETDRDNTP